MDQELRPEMPQRRSWIANRWIEGRVGDLVPGPVLCTKTEVRYVYEPRRQAFGASSVELEGWLLACALRAHPAEELPFADLVRLPELFPFRFTLAVTDLRADGRFDVQRQGPGWEMVGVRGLGRSPSDDRTTR